MSRMNYQLQEQPYNLNSDYLDESRFDESDYGNHGGPYAPHFNPDYHDQLYQERPSYNVRPASRNASEAGNSFVGSTARMPVNNINKGYFNHTPDMISNVSEDVNPLDERLSEHSYIPGGRSRPNNNMPIIQESNRPISRNSMRPSYQEMNPNDPMAIHSSSFILNDSSGLLNNSYKPQSTHTLNKSHTSNQFEDDLRFRKPELAEVIDFLSHHSDPIKANAAAYLQHLSYMDDNIKAQTRVLRGIPPLLELVNHPLPEVHRAACGALRNLSCGKVNDDNKREIRNLSGITTLVRLIRKTTDQDILELVTGIIWNLSSCAELKRPIIDDSLKTLMDQVIIPLSGLNRSDAGVGQQNSIPNYRSTIFRNASGVLRNVSSDGDYARKKMRECDGLVESLVSIVGWSIRNQDCDNKSIENCVCVLRNLSYACQEVADPNYLKNKILNLNEKDSKVGCFGNKSKSVSKQKTESRNQNPGLDQSKVHTTTGMQMLWSPKILDIYFPLINQCSNPETLEATVGAIQNLAACDWQPSIDLRAAVRKEKGGINSITKLLNYSYDKVVCATATSLRNLALDDKNKELIGKHALKDLVGKLPSSPNPTEFPLSNETIAAVESTLYEVIKSNSSFARSFVDEGGVEKLISISKSSVDVFDEKVVRYAKQLLQKIWKYIELHDELKRRGWKQSDFNFGTLPPSSAQNTINRPIMSQGKSQYEGSSLQRPVSYSNKSHNYQNTAEDGIAYPAQREDDIALDALQAMQLNDRYRSSNRSRDPYNYNYTGNNNNQQNSYNPSSSNNTYNRANVDPYYDPERDFTPLPPYSGNPQNNFNRGQEYSPYTVDPNSSKISDPYNSKQVDQLYSKAQRTPANTDSWV